MNKKKKFKTIPSPFGTLSYDERKTTEAFEDFMGGPDRARQIERIWADTYPSPHTNISPYYKTKKEIFRQKAEDAGFTAEEIEAFLML